LCSFVCGAVFEMDYLSYGYALAITLGGVIGYVKAGKHSEI